jgi:PAS domain S-box-containing protein
MRIKSSLVVSIVASVLVSTVIACAAFFILRGMKIELDRSRVYDEAMTKANALNVLLASLKEGSNASDLPQILNVHASLNDLLNKMSSLDALEESLIKRIKIDNEKLGFILDQVFASGTGGRLVLDRERKEILDSQLWMKVRQIYDEIYRLRVMSRSRIVAAQANAGITVFLLLVTIIFSNTLISVLSGRKIVQSEESLRQSEARYRSLFEAANVGKSVTLPSGKINVNRAFCELLGYGPEELRDKTWQELTPAEDIGPISDLLAPLLRGEQDTARFEKRYIHKNGSHVWGDVSAAMQRDSDGKPLYFVTTIVDITASKRAESERDRLFNLSIDMLCIAGFDGFFKQVNPAWEKLLGWTDQELLAKPWLDFVHPEDRAATIAAGEQLAAGEAVYGFENRYLCRDGSYRWVAWNSFPLLEEGLILSVVRDVTERKEAEAAILREKILSDTIIESLPGIFYLYDEQLRFSRVNRRFEEVTGYTAAEIANLSPLDFFAGPDRELLAQRIQQVFTEGQADVEAFFVTKSGDQIPYYFTGTRMTLEGQNYLEGVGVDITARTRAEESRRESEERFRSLVKLAPIPLCFVNQEGVLSYVNNRFIEVFGYTPEDVPTLKEWWQLAYPDAAYRDWVMATWDAAVQKAAQTGADIGPIEYHVTCKNGAVRVVEISGITIGDTFLATFIDLTERQRAEAAVRESEAILRTLIDANPEGLFLMDPEGLVLAANDTLARRVGKSVPEMIGACIYDLTPPDLAVQRKAVIDQVIASGEPIQFDDQRGDRFIDNRIHPIIDPDGRVRKVAVLGIDITERQQAEAALRQSEEMYRSLFDNMLNGLAYFKMLFEHDQPQDFTYLNVNHAFETLTGLQNVVGKKVSEVIPGLRESNPGMFEIFGRVAVTGQPERFEDYVEPLQMWFALSVYSPAKEYFVVVFDVITARKRAEAALQQQFHDMATLYAASQVFLGQIGVAATSQETSRLAVKHFGLRMAWVGLIHPGDYLVHPAASYGDDLGYLNGIRITWDDSPTGRGPTGTAIRTRQLFIMNNIETDAAFIPWREAAMARGYRSSVAIPLCTDDEVLGALNLYSEQAGFFQPDRLPVMHSFANQVAVALQKARLYEEIQRNAAELEDRVAERTAQLKSANSELDRFAYSVSHDLRAPLRAMQGFSQALLEDYAGELDPSGQDYARRINSASERMDRLIQDLLAYSRISREEMALQPVSLEQTVAEAMAHLEGDFQARQAQVRVEPPLPEVQAHRATLLQTVANLVSNAIKFTAPGVQPQVRLWAEDRGERVRLWVEDNGLGIAPEHQERIFRIFERLHGIEAYPGTGIGLAIVKKGVERMGGQIGVESELGQGSRFWVELEKAV